jgi:hypothetical protein
MLNKYSSAPAGYSFRLVPESIMVSSTDRSIAASGGIIADGADIIGEEDSSHRFVISCPPGV